jgi:hypothetical protein
MARLALDWRRASIAGALREAISKCVAAYSSQNTSDSSQGLSSVAVKSKPAEAKTSPEDIQLSKVTGLDVNWAVEGGEPPNEVAYSNARMILEVLNLKTQNVKDLNLAYITASADGGIAICFKASGVFSDIECHNSGEIWAMISEGTNEPEVWPLEKSKVSISHTLERITAALVVNA